MVTKKIKLWCFGLNFCSYIDLMAFRTSWKFQSKTMFLSWGVVPSLVENYVSLSSLITSFKWSIILVLNFFKTTSINSHYWSCNINTTYTSCTRRYSRTAPSGGWEGWYPFCFGKFDNSFLLFGQKISNFLQFRRKIFQNFSDFERKYFRIS